MAALLVGLAAMAYFTVQVTTADAHDANNYQRISSMEYGPGLGLDEAYCARIVSPSSTSLAAAKGALSTALTGGDSSDYHGLNSNKVKFIQSATACSGTSPDGRSLRYHFRSTWDGQLSISCAKNCAAASGPFYWHGSHYNYNSYNVYIRDISVNSHTINHETGHALGMKDVAFGCTTGSIMHYQCSAYSFPTSADRTTVTSNSQGT